MSKKEFVEHVICRYKNKKSADDVCKMMNFLFADFCVHVNRSPISESDIKRGVGEWAIYYDDADLSGAKKSDVSHIVSLCFDLAEKLVLVDVIAATQPKHHMLCNWVLSPENRDKISKYYVRNNNRN